MVNQFDVFLIDLDPTKGSEIKKTRPCVIASPNEMNKSIRTVIIAPLTSTQRPYPTRIKVRFQDKDGDIVIDQIRTIDKSRLIKKLGMISKKEARNMCHCLQDMFDYQEG